jgi:hypothetical protein
MVIYAKEIKGYLQKGEECDQVTFDCLRRFTRSGKATLPAQSLYQRQPMPTSGWAGLKHPTAQGAQPSSGTNTLSFEQNTSSNGRHRARTENHSIFKQFQRYKFRMELNKRPFRVLQEYL